VGGEVDGGGENFGKKAQGGGRGRERVTSYPRVKNLFNNGVKVVRIDGYKVVLLTQDFARNTSKR